MRDDYEQFRAAGGDVAVVGMGWAELAAKFKQQFALPFPVLVDVEQKAYRAFGVPRGSIWAFAGPTMWWRLFVSLLRYGTSLPSADVFQMPGAFVVDTQGIVRFAHYFRTSSDYPKNEQILAVLEEIGKKGSSGN